MESNLKRKRSPSAAPVAPAPFNKPADFIIRTSQDTQFHVSSVILSFASPYFHDLVPNANPRKPFVFNVPEPDATIETILRLIYPIPDPTLHDLGDIADAYAAALKYQLDAATDSLRKLLLLPCFLGREPVRVYAIARRFGLVEEANLAADEACKRNPAEWPSCKEFDHVSGAVYQDLVLHHRKWVITAVRILDETQVLQQAGLCLNCRSSWYQEYAHRVKPMLTHAPTRNDVFGPTYVAGLGTLCCKLCVLSALKATKPGAALDQLREEIRAVGICVVEGKQRVRLNARYLAHDAYQITLAENLSHLLQIKKP